MQQRRDKVTWYASRALVLAIGIIAAFIARADTPPDFSGLWMPHGFGPRSQNPLPFTPGAQKMHDDYVAKFTVDDDPGGFCIKPGMPRSIWGARFPVEIFQRPHDITMIFEGYFQYRKIYLEGYDRPDPILHTQMGYSVGHWEGDTLVVKTDHLREYPYMARTPTSTEATIVERLRIEEREENGKLNKFLVNELVLTDPLIYTEPVHIRGQLIWSPDSPIMEYSCSETIWEDYLIERGLEVPDFEQLRPE